jgi:hypothetical protein
MTRLRKNRLFNKGESIRFSERPSHDVSREGWAVSAVHAG